MFYYFVLYYYFIFNYIEKNHIKILNWQPYIAINIFFLFFFLPFCKFYLILNRCHSVKWSRMHILYVLILCIEELWYFFPHHLFMFSAYMNVHFSVFLDCLPAKASMSDFPFKNMAVTQDLSSPTRSLHGPPSSAKMSSNSLWTTDSTPPFSLTLCAPAKA